MTNFNNNEDKICLLLKDDVNGSGIKSRARSYNHKSRNHGVTQMFPLPTLQLQWPELVFAVTLEL